MVTKSSPGSTLTYLYSGVVCSNTLGGIGTFGEPWTDQQCKDAIEYTAETYDAEQADFVVGESVITYDSGRGKFNFCEHTKEKQNVYVSRKGYVEEDKYYSSYYRRILYNYRVLMYCVANPGDYAPPWPSPIESIDEGYRRLAWAALEPQLNTGLSLINFFLELRDFSQLFGSARTLTRKLQLLTHDAGYLLSTKTAADLLLTYSFGISPLIDDVIGMYNNLVNLDKILNDFVQAGKKSNSYHFRHELWARSSSIKEDLGYKVRSSETGMYYATMKATYEYVNVPDIGTFLRIMGLRPTPEALWNAIPFTFIVDWVFKVNKFLAQFDEDPRLIVHVTDYCDTIKVSNKTWAERTLTNDGKYLPRYYEGSKDEPTIWLRERSRYLRVPGSPNTGYALPVSDYLSGRELVLGGALLRTRTRG